MEFNMGRKRIKRENLKVGMILADDVYNVSDQLILPRKTILSDKNIAKLLFHHIPAVTIMEAGETGKNKKEEVIETKPSEQSEERKQLSKSYNKATAQVRSSLDILVKNINDTEALDSMLLSVNMLLDQMRSAGDIFEILVQMREDSDSVYQHSLNVAMVSVTLGRWLRFSEKELHDLLISGLLHDIGKLLIPQNILLKPYKLNNKEFHIIKSHTLRGYQLIKKMQVDDQIKQAVLLHHERCDGSGYPMGAVRDKISAFAKIVAIADVYDAMTSNRTYRDSISPFDVIAQFEADGLQLFEIEYIMTFLKNIANLYIHNKVRLSDDRIGEIIMINQNNLSRPVIQVEDTYIDLSKENDLKIEEVLLE